MISMNDILKQIEYIPVFNRTAQRALQLLVEDVDHNKEIAEVIKYDPGLTANVLKLANSAYFAHAVEIKDLKGAVNYLGRDKMYQILTLSTASQYFKKLSKGYEMIQGELWKHSISTGIIAEHLSFLEPKVNKSTLFTAGILHDIGKTILSLWVSDLWTDILYLIENQGLDFVEAEKRVLGYTHALVGGAILQRWLFPDDVILAARNHHDSKIHPNPVVRIIRLSDYFAISMGFMSQQDNMLYKGYEDLMDHYKIQTKDLENIFSNSINIIQSVLDDFTAIS
ncbi:MAG: HDOD domain-containing protein [Candidatus Cloacimonetes bacterium]|nr:HDOD domain-containing protein [Candidatus Cloacimonadota bacterium]